LQEYPILLPWKNSMGKSIIPEAISALKSENKD
jgi:hypothetical protein